MISGLRNGDPGQVGPYRLLGRLGGGGMGRVYLGRSPGGYLVAVKLIHAELADDPDFRARFTQEVAAARRVSGIFTAAVLDADADAPMPWLATTYVPGPSLAQAVQRYGPLPVDSVLALAAGLAEGLVAVHAAGVVHRDLKPANVLLASDGPRLIDFGISRAAEATSLTRSGVVIGSPGFMSPEQAEGADVRWPSDVFSLGAVIAFAATGQSPFGAGPTPALLYRVVYGEPDLSSLPVPLQPLVRNCLVKDPRFRLSPAEILAETSSAPSRTSPTGDWLPASIQEALTQYQPKASGDLAGASVSTITSASPQAPVPSPGAPVPPASPDRRGWGLRRWLLAATALVVLAAGAVGARSLFSPPARPSLAVSVPPRHDRKVSLSPSPRSSSPFISPPSMPTGVTATATSQYRVQISWSETSTDVSGFVISNGCPPGSCGTGATLEKQTGPVSSTQFAVSPGTYQCFEIAAINRGGQSAWSPDACVSTSGLTVAGSAEWTSTGVKVRAGDDVGITATGQVLIAGQPEGPDGDQSCTPSPEQGAGQFPAPRLPCWSLIARVGNGPPLEVGSSRYFTVTSSGELYLGVNDNNPAGNSGNWTARIKLGGLPPA